MANNFMPGEMSGIPQHPDRINGLLSNPFLQIGLGILANNQGNYGRLAPAIGKGALYGMQQLQAQKQFEIEQKQMEAMQKFRDAQVKQIERETQSEARKQSALDNLIKSNPQLADLAVLDQKAFIKAAYPQAGSEADPYYQAVPTNQGLARFNARTGQLELITDTSGKPYVKSADDPLIRGAVKDAEARSSANYKVNTDIPGNVLTDTQVSDMARGGLPTNNFSTPYPVTFGAPGTTKTDMQEGVTGEQSIQLRDPANPRRPSGLGVRIPTPEQQAALTEQAKSSVELRMKPAIESATVSARQTAESEAKRDSNMRGLGSIIDEARGVLQGKVKPTSSALGSIADAVGGAAGLNVRGAAEADQLKAIGGALVAKMPRMEGPQSNFDVQNYQRMAGDVGNERLPIERRLKALDTVEKLWRKYDKASSQQSSPKVRKYNPKTGRIE